MKKLKNVNKSLFYLQARKARQKECQCRALLNSVAFASQKNHDDYNDLVIAFFWETSPNYIPR